MEQPPEFKFQSSIAGNLTLKEVENIELRSKCEGLEKEVEKYRGICAGFEEQVARMKEEYRIVLASEEKAQERISRLVEAQKEDRNVWEKFLQLRAEVRDLEKAKESAVDEIDVWRRKCMGLGVRVVELMAEKNEVDRLKTNCADLERRVMDLCQENVKLRAKEQEMCEKMVGKKDKQSYGNGVVIEISDGEDEVPVRYLDWNIDVEETSSEKKATDEGFEKRSLRGMEDDKCSNQEEKLLSTVTPKRKCSSRVIASDSEDEDADDKIPIGRLKLRRITEVSDDVDDNDDGHGDDCDVIPIGKFREANGSSANCSAGGYHAMDIAIPRKRRLFTLREGGKTKGSGGGASLENSDEKESASLNIGCLKEEDMQEGEENVGDEANDGSSESEGESLGGFIVSGSEVEDSESSSTDATSSSPSQQSGGELDLVEVLSKIRRKMPAGKWEYEADMLASFGKDPEVCMKAVCAIYRRQTSDEQSVKESLLSNNRGFSKLDALKGSKMAEFLLDGDPHGPLKKSVEELQKYDPHGMDYCLYLATRYSKQLFMIYQNKEDPFLLPL